MNSLGVVSLLIILIVAGTCSCQEEIVYGQCKKDHDCAKMCAPGCKTSCLVGSGLCRCECTNNARKTTTVAKIAYGQCKKDQDCAKMCAPGCKPSCLVGSGLCRCECTNNATKTMTAAKIVYHQCQKNHDCDAMVAPSCKQGCKPACYNGLCICKC
ncbi:hypothetical protein V6N11_081123 [Hibiscus sabdariffa]|uniref:Uncharacterized protein n=1 Tax=Hibiscus sabdariffa TaxID=183260 RepID=A0ABR2QJ24_9ROSI